MPGKTCNMGKRALKSLDDNQLQTFEQIFAKITNNKFIYKGVASKNPKFRLLQSTEEASIPGVLRLVLHISRVFTVAPLAMQTKKNTLRVRSSLKWRLYSYIMVTIMSVFCLTNLVFDLMSDSNTAVRARGGMTSVVWVAEVLLVVGVAMIGAYGSGARTANMIRVMNTKEKLEQQLGNHVTSLWSEQRQTAALMLFGVYSVVLWGFDFKMILDQSVEEGRNLSLVHTLFAYYFIFAAAVVLEVKFVFVALEVLATMKSLNNALRHELDYMEIKTKSERNYLGYDIIPDVKKYNMILDNLSVFEKVKYPAESSPIDVERSLRCLQRLTMIHGSLCQLVKSVDQTHGPVLILLLLSTTMHVIITPYYIIVFGVDETYLTQKLVLQMFWIVYHMSTMFAVIEPCHWTYVEGKRTEELVSSMTRLISMSSNPLTEQLNLFFRQLLMSNVRYEPMGFCVLTRPLIGTIMGAAITYLVILVQFQKVNHVMNAPIPT